MTPKLTSDSKPSYDFSPERPIVSRTADRLDRTPFAEHVAAAIRGWTGNDSLIVALYGEWGTGKSSLKNLIVEALRSQPQTAPYIVEFNPWQWAGQEQLFRAFFQEIGAELGRKDGTEQAKASAKRWRKYGALLGLSTEIFSATRRIALFGLAVIASLSFLGAFLDFVALKVAFIVIGSLSLVGIGLLNIGRKFSNALTEYFAAVAETEDKTLNEVKSELSASLRSLKRPMLVVVDDVDRLSGPEIKILFQLIKANADFPNMVYLTLFQREVVEQALTRELSMDGREYLKKIVQVEFDVPILQRPRLEEILFSKLDVLLANEAILKLWNQDRWTNIFIPGLRPYFRTLRDVYRFISTLSLQFSVFSKKETFEVNPIDLIALETLRVFEPEVFKALPASKTALTTTLDSRNSRTEREPDQK